MGSCSAGGRQACIALWPVGQTREKKRKNEDSALSGDETNTTEISSLRPRATGKVGKTEAAGYSSTDRGEYVHNRGFIPGNPTGPGYI